MIAQGRDEMTIGEIEKLYEHLQRFQVMLASFHYLDECDEIAVTEGISKQWINLFYDLCDFLDDAYYKLEPQVSDNSHILSAEMIDSTMMAHAELLKEMTLDDHLLEMTPRHKTFMKYHLVLQIGLSKLIALLRTKPFDLGNLETQLVDFKSRYQKLNIVNMSEELFLKNILNLLNKMFEEWE